MSVLPDTWAGWALWRLPWVWVRQWQRSRWRLGIQRVQRVRQVHFGEMRVPRGSRRRHPCGQPRNVPAPVFLLVSRLRPQSPPPRCAPIAFLLTTGHSRGQGSSRRRWLRPGRSAQQLRGCRRGWRRVTVMLQWRRRWCGLLWRSGAGSWVVRPLSPRLQPPGIRVLRWRPIRSPISCVAWLVMAPRRTRMLGSCWAMATATHSMRVPARVVPAMVAVVV